MIKTNYHNATNLSPPTYTSTPRNCRHASSQVTNEVRQPVHQGPSFPCLDTRPMVSIYDSTSRQRLLLSGYGLQFNSFGRMSLHPWLSMTTMVGRYPLGSTTTPGSKIKFERHGLLLAMVAKTLLRGMSLVRRALSCIRHVCSVAVRRITEDFGVDCRVTLRVRGSA